jgi:hypothetical protein
VESLQEEMFQAKAVGCKFTLEPFTYKNVPGVLVRLTMPHFPDDYFEEFISYENYSAGTLGKYKRKLYRQFSKFMHNLDHRATILNCVFEVEHKKGSPYITVRIRHIESGYKDCDHVALEKIENNRRGEEKLRTIKWYLLETFLARKTSGNIESQKKDRTRFLPSDRISTYYQNND